METQTKPKLSPEKILGIIAACALALLIVVTLVSLPYILRSDDPQQEQMGHMQATAAPTDAPTEPEETVPPPELNPYGKLDFQYDGMFLSCLRTETVPGIDVSAYQGDVDWVQVAASGIKFAIVRLGYRGYETGKLVEDSVAQKNLRGAQNVGLDVGAYFFSQAVTPEEAEEEARYVLELLDGFELTMPVIYDWEYISDEARTAEVDRRTLTDCALAFCRTIAEGGYTPMVYFNRYQSMTMLYLYELEEYPFWLAMYTDRMTYPYRVEMWQYTCTGRVPGIEGDVDINVYFPKG